MLGTLRTLGSVSTKEDAEVVVDGLELDGALHLASTGCARGLQREPSQKAMKLRTGVAGLQVQNRGVSIVGIPDSELADASPSHQIRGRTGFNNTVCQQLSMLKRRVMGPSLHMLNLRYKADILEMTSRHLEGDAG